MKANFKDFFEAMKEHARLNPPAPEPRLEKSEAEIAKEKAELQTRIYDRLIADGVSARFLQAKRNGQISPQKGYMSQFDRALSLINGQKSIILADGTGCGKSFLCFELICAIKGELALDGVYYSRASILVGEFKANFSNPKKLIENVFFKSDWYSGKSELVKCVFVDELHSLTPSDYGIISEIVVAAYDLLVPMVLISNQKDLRDFSENLSDMAKSRMKETFRVLKMKGAVDLRLL